MTEQKSRTNSQRHCELLKRCRSSPLHETFTKRSIVPATPDEVWDRITTPDGINEELSPWMKMTVPEALRGKSIHHLELGKHVCRSYFLLFGFIPFDYDDITIAELEHGKRFRETSSMGSIRNWEHERTLRPVEGGTEVTDRVTLEMRWPLSRIPGLQHQVAKILALLFDHRHRRLARTSFASHPNAGAEQPGAR